MGAAAAIMIRKEKEIVDVFARAGATTVTTAQSLGALALEDDRAMRRLRRRAIVREAAPGLWYVDTPGWTALRHRRRVLTTVLLTIVLAVLVIVALQSRNILSP
jgi:transposase InsO family protein